MNIYTKKRVFSRESGEEEGHKLVLDHVRCDLTGALIDHREENDWEPEFSFDYGFSDPCFGSDGREYQFGDEHSVDMHEFLGCKPYHIVSHGGDPAIQAALVEAYAKLSQSLWSSSLSWFLRESRVATATKLITEGVIEAWQLGCSEDL